MKTWKVVLIASVAGFLHGFILQQHPTILRQTTVGVSSLPWSTWVDGVSRSKDAVFKGYMASIMNFAKSKVTAPLATLAPMTVEPRGAYAAIEEPSTGIQAEKAEDGLSGIRVANGFLSVDVGNMSLLWLLEEIGKTCHIEISGKNILSDSLVSLRFNNVELEDGLRELMRVSGVRNHALSYRNNAEGQYSVSHLYILPHDGGVSEDYYLADAER